MSGFVDLRLNRDAGTGADSFWPSFTDIMSVIVMIFLITTSVLIIRNWELVKQITNALQAEQTALETARNTNAEKASLEDQLIQAQHQLSMTRVEVLRIQAINQQQTEQLQAAQETQQQLRNEHDELQQQLDSANTNNAQLNQMLQNSNTELTSSREQNKQLQQLVTTNQTRINQLETAAAQQQQLLTQLRNKADTSQQRLSSLQSDYDVLKGKYDHLMRPARTAVGKYVVEVRYQKTAQQFQIDLREPEDKDYRRLNEHQLHEVLSKLATTHPDTLYIKIVFPENSGLSYTEAWSFTQQLLTQYDYYQRSP